MRTPIMRIETVETHLVQIPLKPAFRMVSSLGSHEVSTYVLVRLITDEGLEGAGEATVMPRWSGETAYGAQYLIDTLLTPAVRGADPSQIEDVVQRMDRVAADNWFAKSAIEMACWDVWGKQQQQPVYQLLGGAQRPLAMRGRFSLGAYEPDRARRRAQELIDLGFDTIKVKVGGPCERDFARVSAVREVIGPERELYVDANCGWDADSAIACIEQMKPLRLGLIEQPTPRGDYEALRRVRESTDVPVMADDTCFDFVHAKELIRLECCQVISVYPGKNGGILRSKQIADYAEPHGVACSVGSNLELDIATAAMGHLVVGTRNLQIEKFPGDIYGPVYHEESVVIEPLRIEGPITHLTDRPGLGVEVDWARIGRFKP